jgi:tetrahydromethanopterin S-methyltransferase subunit D
MILLTMQLGGTGHLTDTAGQIKPEWTTFRDTLKVAASTGLTCSHQGGSVILADGAIATISPASLSVTNNATNYVYVNEVGTVAVGSLLPVRCTPLAGEEGEVEG